MTLLLTKVPLMAIKHLVLVVMGLLVYTKYGDAQICNISSSKDNLDSSAYILGFKGF